VFDKITSFQTMKTTLIFLFSLAFLALPLCAEEMKFSGKAMCAKCELKQKDECQMALKVKNSDGNEETLLVENNKIAKDFHGKICKKTLDVNATGTLTTQADGQKMLTLNSIFEAK